MRYFCAEVIATPCEDSGRATQKQAAWNQVVALSLVLAMPLFSGCGDAKNRRFEISGTVTLKGAPIQEGVIEFQPLENSPTMGGALILNSKYSIPRNKGLALGKYRVNIYAGDGSDGRGAGGLALDNPPPKGAKGIDRVPPQYNSRSKLVFEVSPTEKNEFNFNVP